MANYVSQIGKFDIEGVDVSAEILRGAARDYKNIRFRQASVYQLPYRDNAFDLVIASEVLEHIDNPLDAMEECYRVSRKYALFSVPNEPFWRMANLMRFHYLSRLGNTPGHIQHYRKSQLVRLIERKFKLVEVKVPVMWVVVLARK